MSSGASATCRTGFQSFATPGRGPLPLSLGDFRKEVPMARPHTNEFRLPQPGGLAQGSSCLPTLGFEAESLWDLSSVEEH
jgi:hypothetical protein